MSLLPTRGFRAEPAPPRHPESDTLLVGAGKTKAAPVRDASENTRAVARLFGCPRALVDIWALFKFHN